MANPNEKDPAESRYDEDPDYAVEPNGSFTVGFMKEPREALRQWAQPEAKKEKNDEKKE
jgi:hypothetical protein